MRTTGGKSVLLWVAILASSQTATAADRENFFSKNSARDVLSETVLDSDIEGIEFFHKSKPKVEEPLPEPDIHRVNINMVDPKQKPTSQELPKDPEAAKQILLAKYGDPGKDEPILAKDDSPKPFKAMMEAKEAGLEDLAFQYAKQHVRFIQANQDRTMYITGLLGQAQVDEGLVPEQSWVNSPQFEEQKRLRLKEAERRAAAGEDEFDPEAISAKTLDQRARELLESAKEAEDYPVEHAKLEQPKAVIDEKVERKKLKALLKGRVPAAPDGKIDVYIFARLNDQRAIETLQAFNQLYKQYSADSRINFVAFTPEASAVSDIDNFKAWNQFSFPYRVGSDTAKSLEVKRSPTLIFAARSTGEFIKEEGARPFYVLEEILNAMKGS